MVIVYILLAYVLIVWIGTRLVVPHLGFTKDSLPQNIPSELEQYIQQLSSESVTNLDLLKKSYDYVTGRYHGSRVKTIMNFWKAFQDPITARSGFMPCNGQNYLLRLMLIKSGRFTEGDVQVKVVPLNLFIHQYLQVNVDGCWIDVDPWSNFLAVPLGKRSAFIR